MLSFLAAVALLSAQEPAPSFAQAALHGFDLWDANRDGTLTEEEVDRAALDPRFHDEDAAVLAALHTYLAAAFDAPRLTKAWFTAYRPTKFKVPVEAPGAEKKRLRRAYAATPGSLQSGFVADLRRLRKGGTTSLFEGDGPSLADIRQGKLGDCFFLAPLGAVVQRDPAAVRRMIRPSGAGYEVAFGDGTKVRVAGPTDAEIAMGGSSVADGLWVRVMEKAYGSRKFAEGEAATRIARDELGGGNSGVAARSLTGREFVRVDLGGGRQKLDDATLASRLAQVRRDLPRALADRRLVLTGTVKGDAPTSITPNHAYAVLGFDPATDVVTIWNPHGNDFKPKGPEGLENGFRRVDGVFSMPLALFGKVFSRITFEQPASPARG